MYRNLCRPGPRWHIVADMFLHVPWPDWYSEYAQTNTPDDDDAGPRVPSHGLGAGAATILRDTAAFFNKAWPSTPLFAKAFYHFPMRVMMYQRSR